MTGVNVMLVEDSKEFSQLVHAFLEPTDHSIGYEAATLHQALSAVDRIGPRPGDLACTAVMLDNDLEDARDCAGTVLSHIRSKKLGIYVIGFSSISLIDRGVAVDKDLTKLGIGQLVATLDNITTEPVPRAA